MAGKQRRKNNVAKHKDINKSRRTRHYKKDLDQVINDLEPDKFFKLTHQDIQEDKPGLGQFYCVWCSRDFINQNTLDVHQKSKEHKKRLRALREEEIFMKSDIYHLVK